ncbi:unnamed protein product [Tuber aestivum]|uniref:Uncharacterized protein n=1 Tax=Tuber aestivum TaxID=59557 RepID=A0A292PZ35_9PEZI|nr:unnamed protein product [Tuber aestivum]
MLLKSLPALALLMAFAHAVALPDSLAEPDFSKLDKRDCISDGCYCKEGSEGDYCGYCIPLQPGYCPDGANCEHYLYHCGSGKCCRYQNEESCKRLTRRC